MTKMLRKMLMLVTIAMLLSVVFIPTINKATELDLNSIIEDDPEDPEDPEDPDPDPVIQEPETNTGTENRITDKDYKENTTNTDNTNNTSTNEEIPKTGLTEDITIMAIIGLCVVSAVIGYKKAAEYKL